MAKTGITSNIDAFIKDAENFKKSLREEVYAKTIREAAKWIGVRAVTQYSIGTKGIALGKGKGMRGPSYRETGTHPNKFTHRTGKLAKSLMGVYHRTMRDSQLLIKVSGRKIVGIIRITVESPKGYKYAKRVEKDRPFLAPAVKDAEKVIPRMFDKNLKAVGKKWGFKVG